MPDNPRSEYSARLAALMADAGESQAQLADAVGVNQASVSLWITQGRVPYKETLSRLADHFGVRPEWLVAGRGPRNAPKSPELEAFPKDLRSDLVKIGEAARSSKDVRGAVAHLARVFRPRQPD